MILLEYIYYKPKSCMIRRSEKEPTEQAEAKAITNLLQVDFKTSEELPFWDEKKMVLPNAHPKKPYSLFRVQYHPREHHNNRVRVNLREDGCSRRKNLQHCAAVNQEEEFEKQTPQMARTEREGSFKRMKQGKSWLSQVDFSDSPMKEFTSQPKLNKKYSFSYEANCKKERSDPQPELNNKIEAQSNEEDFVNPSLYEMSSSLNLQCKASKSTRKGSKSNRIYPKSIQDYMRQTFDHILQKGDQSSNHPFKQPQQQTSTIVRKLLINLQHLKHTRPPSTILETPLPQKKRLVVRKYNDGCFRFDRTAIQTPISPQRSHKSRPQYILDLNMQAENIYSIASIHQNSAKKNHILPKMQ